MSRARQPGPERALTRDMLRSFLSLVAHREEPRTVHCWSCASRVVTQGDECPLCAATLTGYGPPRTDGSAWVRRYEAEHGRGASSGVFRASVTMVSAGQASAVASG